MVTHNSHLHAAYLVAAERPNKLPKRGLGFGKNYVNTKLWKPNERGSFGSTLFNC